MQKAMIDQYTVLVEILVNIPTIKAFNGYKAASLSFLAQVLPLHLRVCCVSDVSSKINRSARLQIYFSIISQAAQAMLSTVMDACQTGMTCVT
jgi:hypothetical protein